MNRIFIGGLILFAFVRCSNLHQNPTNTELLTVDYWKIESITLSPPIVQNDNLITDYFNSNLFPECQKDNLIQFYDSIYKNFDHLISCSGKKYILPGGKWKFSSEETQIITTNYLHIDQTYHILSLTENNLNLEFSAKLNQITGSQHDSIFRIICSFSHNY